AHRAAALAAAPRRGPRPPARRRGDLPGSLPAHPRGLRRPQSRPKRGQRAVRRPGPLHALGAALRGDLGAAGGRGGRRDGRGAAPEAALKRPYRRKDGLMRVPGAAYLIVSAILFTTGAVGVLIRRNVLVMFMCIELMLNAVNLSFVTFGRMMHALDGQVAVFFVLVVAAAEVVVGLAIIVAIFRRRASADADQINLLKW